MKDRKKNILIKIVENYIKKGSPIGSLVLSEKFSVSSATIRKEMNLLEKEGMLTNLHTSSGRIPTKNAYKKFLDFINSDEENFGELNKNREIAKKEFEKIKKDFALKKAKDKISESLKILSSLTKNIAFATIPEDGKNIFLGLGNFLRENAGPSGIGDIEKISSVIEVFEGGLLSKINNVNISETEVKVFIGDENIFPQFESCSMLAIRYNVFGYEGVIGILGAVKMDYLMNIALLEEAKAMIDGDNFIKKIELKK